MKIFKVRVRRDNIYLQNKIPGIKVFVLKKASGRARLPKITFEVANGILNNYDQMKVIIVYFFLLGNHLLW